MLISENYRSMSEEMHRTKPHYGDGSANHAEKIRAVAGKIGTTRILDYGAGKRALARALPEFEVASYDPGVPSISARPQPAPLVVCTDVLEHVEPYCLNSVLDDLRDLTLTACFFTIHTGRAAKHLPDGRNAHLIQQPCEWWMLHLMSRWKVWNVTVAENGFIFIGAK